MAGFIIFREDGKIMREGHTPDGMEYIQVESGEFMLIEDYRENTYVDINSMSVVDKIEMPSIINKTEVSADGNDEVLINNLEIPTEIKLSEFMDDKYNIVEQYEINDGSFEISFDEEGSYKIILSSLHFLDKEYIVTAIEA